jgi:hypothetical protein
LFVSKASSRVRFLFLLSLFFDQRQTRAKKI